VTRERGAATLVVGTCLSVLLLLGAALGVVAAMVHAHRVAQAAADLAALAGATALARGDDGCARARELAVVNGARVLACRTLDRDVWVSVAVEGPGWLGQRGDLAATARAGPGATATTAPPSAGGIRGVPEHQVEQRPGGVLVQRLVLVAALG
jgi:secretion/DNA translocation related TadE-like protein